MRRAIRLRSGRIQVPFSGTYTGELIRVGKDYASVQQAFDARINTATWQETRSLSSSVTTTIGSATISGASFYGELSENSFLTIGANTLAVRDIQSDTSARLWHGAPTSTTASATLKIPKRLCIQIPAGDFSVTGTIPDGVDLQLVGVDRSARFIQGGLTHAQYCRLAIANMTLRGGTYFVLPNAASLGGNGRSILDARGITIDDAASFGQITFFGSSISIRDIVGLGFKFNCQSDYFDMQDVSCQVSVDSDVLLLSMSSVFSESDIGYQQNINNYRLHKYHCADGSFDGGIECNTWNANKVLNVNGSVITNYDTSTVPATPSRMIWTPTVGTLNFNNCILHSEGSTLEEVYRRGATVNLVNSTRLDGSAIRLF